jgi:hypothetical protein
MSPASFRPADSVDDYLARRLLLTGEISPREFAAQIVERRFDRTESSRQRHFEKPGPLLRRGAWSPLRRAWLCLQVAILAGIPAALAFERSEPALLFTLGLIAVSSFSLCIALLGRSSAIREIRGLSRERRHLREHLAAYQLCGESLTESLRMVATLTPDDSHTGAPLLRELLVRTRSTLVAAGHEDIALLVLRQERGRSLLTYSALPGALADGSPTACREIEPSRLDAYRRRSTTTHVVEVDLSGSRQELVAFSCGFMRGCDRLLLDQVGVCLSLAAAASPRLGRRIL